MFAGHTANILVSVISSCIIRFHERVELRLHSNSPGTTTPNPMQGFHGDTGICQTGMCLLMLGLSSRSSQLVFVSIRVSICETVTVGRGRCLRASCNINIACSSVFHHLRGVTENTGGRLGSAKEEAAMSVCEHVPPPLAQHQNTPSYPPPPSRLPFL